MIREIKDSEIKQCVSVIRQSFQTVADEFGFTEENAPYFTAFTCGYLEKALLSRKHSFANRTRVGKGLL